MGILPQASTYASRADQIFLVVFLLSLGFLVGITAVMAPDFYPYLQAGQIVGMLNGLKGGAWSLEARKLGDAAAFVEAAANAQCGGAVSR